MQSGRSQALTTVFFIAPVEAVGQSVTLPAARYTLSISAHEIPRNVALCGEVVARQQLALWWTSRPEDIGRRRKKKTKNTTSYEISQFKDEIWPERRRIACDI